MTRTEILIEEKKLVFDHKMSLLKTLKAIGTINIVLGTLSGSGVLNDRVYVFLPILILIFYWYMVVILQSYNLVCTYLYRIDELIILENSKSIVNSKLTLPLFQYTIGYDKIKRPPGYYKIFAFLLVGLGMISVYAYSVWRGFRFLFTTYTNEHLFTSYNYWLGIIYVIGFFVLFVLLVFKSISYFRNYKSNAFRRVDDSFIYNPDN
jgi:hypothetical protein